MTPDGRAALAGCVLPLLLAACHAPSAGRSTAVLDALDAARLHLAAGDTPGAMSRYRKLTRDHPEVCGPYRILGWLHQVAGECREAASMYHEYLDRCPDGVFASKVRCLIESCQPGRTRPPPCLAEHGVPASLAQPARRCAPSVDEPRSLAVEGAYLAASVHFANGRFAQALAGYEAIIKKQPDLCGPYRRLATIHTLLGRCGEAIRHATEYACRCSSSHHRPEYLTAFVASCRGRRIPWPGHAPGAASQPTSQPASRPVPRCLPATPLAGRAGFDLLLMLDRSGSMSGEKLHIAKELARRLAARLGARDRVAVVGFDVKAMQAARFRPAREQNALTRALAQITSGGGTSIPEGLASAARMVARHARRRRVHVLLLSDGQSSYTGAVAAAKKLTLHGTLSTVAVGNSADRTLLTMLARAGRGCFIVVEARASLDEAVGSLASVLARWK